MREFIIRTGCIIIGFILGIILLSAVISLSFNSVFEHNEKVLDKAINIMISYTCFDICFNYEDNCSYCHDYYDNKFNPKEAGK